MEVLFMNSVNLIGRVAQDLELKQTTNGKSVVNFSLAVNEYSNGEQKTSFIDCVAWNRSAEILTEYGHNGSQIGVEGRLQKRQYTDKNNQTRYVIEVVVNHIDLLDPKSDWNELTETSKSLPADNQSVVQENQTTATQG